MITAKVVANPSAEPLTLLEAYRHLRVDPIDSSDETGRPDDELILGLISAAREYAENFCGVAFALKTYEATLTAFPEDNGSIELPYPPFVSLLGFTLSDDISTNDLDPELYTLDESGDIATISPVNDWPTLATGNILRIRYTSGYGPDSEAYTDVPPSVKAGIALMLGHLYRNREAAGEAMQSLIPLGVESLLRPHRVLLGFA